METRLSWHSEQTDSSHTTQCTLFYPRAHVCCFPKLGGLIPPPWAGHPPPLGGPPPLPGGLYPPSCASYPPPPAKYYLVRFSSILRGAQLNKKIPDNPPRASCPPVGGLPLSPRPLTLINTIWYDTAEFLLNKKKAPTSPPRGHFLLGFLLNKKVPNNSPRTF